MPTENLPAKSFQKPKKPARRVLIKHSLPVPVLHKDLDSVQKSIAKHFLGKKGIDWDFSFDDGMVGDEVFVANGDEFLT